MMVVKVNFCVCIRRRAVLVSGSEVSRTLDITVRFRLLCPQGVSTTVALDIGRVCPDAVRNVSWEQNRENKLTFTIQGTYELTPNPLKTKTNLHL